MLYWGHFYNRNNAGEWSSCLGTARAVVGRKAANGNGGGRGQGVVGVAKGIVFSSGRFRERVVSFENLKCCKTRSFLG